MKKSLILLLFSLSFNWCFADKTTEKLPEVPWRAIVESQKGQRLDRWEGEISVKLFGNYSKSDSLMVVNAISELNQLTKTIHLNMSSHDRGNLKIYFIDSTNQSFYKNIILVNQNFKSQFTYTVSNRLIRFTQVLHIKFISEDSKPNFITNTLAFDLFPNYWFDQSYYNRNLQSEKIQESIFRSTDFNKRKKLLQKGMLDFDKVLLKTVYSPDFEEKLKIAQKQFEHRIFIPEWLKASRYAVLITTFLLLAFPIIAISKKLSNRIIQNISSKFLKYNIEVLVHGFFFSILLSFLITISWRLQSFDFPTQGIFPLKE